VNRKHSINVEQQVTMMNSTDKYTEHHMNENQLQLHRISQTFSMQNCSF